MDIKHSETDWEIQHQPEFDFILILGEGGRLVAQLMPVDDNDKEARERRSRDAAMIQSAPKMHETLEDVKAFLEQYREFLSFTPDDLSLDIPKGLYDKVSSLVKEPDTKPDRN